MRQMKSFVFLANSGNCVFPGKTRQGIYATLPWPKRLPETTYILMEWFVFKGLFVAGFLMLFIPVAGHAETTKYRCMVADTAGVGGIPSQIDLSLDAEANVAQVFDSLIKSVQGEPIPARIATDNVKRVTVTWTLRNFRNPAGQVATLDYRLTMLKADRSASISMTPLGYSNTFHAAGACKIL